MDLTYYEVLGVPSDAPVKQVRAAYHRLLLQLHPDKNGAAEGDLGGPSIAQLQAAYATLSDEQKRLAYDEDLKNTFKKRGLNITGAGLDYYTLTDFAEMQDPGSGLYQWTKDCPRCTSIGSILLLESDLERGTPDGAGGFQIVAPCLACSLWITVLYEEADE
ncbi:diphthamide biosynthesis protein 4 [Metschnikowia aff. pulcherrima]|uniref:Diphthamide biosynthesis protein 4 n=1 Tax=Metschnikowia aff. pulcherrima TaxID=2163413 RepID=A0A4V1AEZ1_9ASCO|nr:diphthamide biosynthesis protein 4 [Metschnikowia aff. pulcherrima]